MSFYRIYRPQIIDEVDNLAARQQLLRLLAKNRTDLPHAYLFSGPKGTGKTTAARLIAKIFNCTNLSKTTGPCGKCGQCTTIANGTNLDVLEIDAASNRGIDEIRQLRERIGFAPVSAGFTVYIIDEVHMLTNEAFNALLKTLEEPPAHVIFILATTELDKVPDTIISRCQLFSFRKPGREIIRKEIMRIAKKEGYELDNGASDLIALLGDGSFRDALGTLEKVIAASSKKKIAREEVEAITGAPRASLVNQFVQNLLVKDSDKAIASLGEAEKAGISMATFCSLILEKMRYILLVQNSPSSKSSIEEKVSPDDWAFILEQSSKKILTPAMLTAILEAADSIQCARISELPLELAVVKICATQ